MATIKSLLDMSVEKLEAMTDEELKAYCEPFVRVVKLEEKEEAPTIVDLTGDGQEPLQRRSKGRKDGGEAWLKEAAKLMKQLGVQGELKLPSKIK